MSDDVHALTGAYVANALPADERRFFERHLAACPACAGEVDQLTEAAGTLAAAEEAPPPASMRAAVLDRIATTPQDPPVTDAHRPRRRRPGSALLSQRVLMPVAAALALIAMITAATAWTLSTRVSELELAAEQMAALMNADDTQFSQAEGPGGSRVRVVMSPGLGTAVVVVADMDPAPHEHTYKLWLHGDGPPRPAGTFDVGDDGTAIHLVSSDMTGVEAIGVTIEPAGGSPVPSGEPIMVVPLRS